MAQIICFVVALISATTIASAVPATFPAYTYVIPEHRTTELRPLKAVEEIPYEYHIVPADEYAVVEYDDGSAAAADASILSSIISSIWEVIPLPSPIAALKNIAYKALSIVKWVVAKGSLVALGVALAFGFCAFTPFCTLVIEKPFSKQIETLNIPYLDDAEYYFRQAYDKYRELS